MGTLEQRKAARFDVEVSAEVYTKSAILTAFTRNLSDSGVCLELETGLQEGTVIGVSLFLTSDGIEDPDTEPLNLKAEVMWCAERDETGYSAGARFNDMSQVHVAALKQFLAALG
jgi:hypothetical protein